MSQFILPGSQKSRIPALLAEATGFKESPEYRQMRAYELDIPGVVCAAFAKYLVRIHSEEHHESNRSRADDTLAPAHRVLEVLASSPETAVKSLVTDEIFENLEGQEHVLARIERNLRPNALALYRHWRGELRSPEQ